MAAARKEFGDSSLPENILTVLGGTVLDLAQLSDTLNAKGESQSKQISDDDILTSLECLRKEGKVCCKKITSDNDCKETLVYWSAHESVQTSSGTKTPVIPQRTRSCIVWKTPCSTPKSSGLRGRTLGVRSTPSSQFVSPLLKRPSGEELVENGQTPKRTRYEKCTKEKSTHRGGPSTVSTECNNNGQDSDAVTVLQNAKRLTYESKDGSLEEDTSTKHSPDEVRRDHKEGGNLKLEKHKMMRDVQEKEECLRKLNMVCKYRTKNNLEELQGLIDKWRNVSQEAAGRLLDKASYEPRPDMAWLLTHLQIEHKLIQYSAEDEDFY